jgi:transcriptional regulator with XRE-family HTH domain
METNFPKWLNDQLENRGWSQAELARRSGISPSQISRLINDSRGIREKSVLGISNALKIPPEDVYREAGLLPRVTQKKSQLEELDHLASLLSRDDLQEVIDYARHRLEKQEEKKQTSRNKKPARNALIGN